MGDDFDSDIEAIRAAATRLGMPAAGPEHDAAVESADDFVARMKRETPTPLPTPRRARWPRIAAASAAAAAVITALTLVVPGGDQPATADTPPELNYQFADGNEVASAVGKPAADALRDLAKTARHVKTDPAPIGVQEVVVSGWFAQLDDSAKSDSARTVPTLQTSELAPDGSVVVDSKRGRPLSIDGRGLKSITGAPENHEEIPAGEVDPKRAQNLGTDPKVVRRALLSDSACESLSNPAITRCLFSAIDTLAHQWVVSPKLAAAFWEILANQEDVRTLGAVRDRAGRAGVGFMAEFPDTPAKRMILIISKDDGRLLGSETVLTQDDVDSGVKAPAVYSFTAILKAHWVDD